MKKPGLSVFRVGPTVAELLFVFPGHLGVLLSVFPAGTARALAGCPELLPALVPGRTEAELAIAPLVAAGRPDSEIPPDLLLSAGTDAWAWINAMILNYMYVGSGRRCMWNLLRLQSPPSPAQKEFLAYIRKFAEIFARESGPFQLGQWEGGPEISDYWGPKLQKAHPLTLEAIVPGLPDKCGSINSPRDSGGG